MALMNNVLRWSPMSALPYGPSFNFISGSIELPNGESELALRKDLTLRALSQSPLPLYHEDQRVAQVAALIPAQVFTHADNSTHSGDGTADSKPPQTTSPWFDHDTDLVCVVTTHRIVLYPQEKNLNSGTSFIRQIPYENIVKVEGEGGDRLFKKESYKILLETRSFGRLIIEFPKSSASHKQRDEMVAHIKKSIYLRFSNYDIDGAGRYVVRPGAMGQPQGGR